MYFLYFEVRVRCFHKKSSRSLSHLMMSFLSNDTHAARRVFLRQFSAGIDQGLMLYTGTVGLHGLGKYWMLCVMPKLRKTKCKVL